jgi:pimeloyl-ACP methyl ester carboxylesterase
MGGAALSVGTLGCLEHHKGPLPGEPNKTSHGPATHRYVDGARVHYVDVGEGPVVVLLHGFASSTGVWSGVIEDLRKHHRVIAVDLKGFGWTDRPEGDYSPKAQAALVLSLLRALGVEQASVVAHSWGSGVAMQLALLDPRRVARVALYDAWLYDEQLPPFFRWASVDGLGELLFAAFYDERADDKMAMAFYDERFVTEALVESVEEQLARPGTKAAALAAVRGMKYAEIERSYGAVTQPVLLLWGREDRVTSLSVGERLVRELPRARLEVFPQCGHFPMIEARAPSTRALREFLSAPSTPSTPPTLAVPSTPAAPAAPSTPAPTGGAAPPTLSTPAPGPGAP